jgi:hypothetical protein
LLKTTRIQAQETTDYPASSVSIPQNVLFYSNTQTGYPLKPTKQQKLNRLTPEPSTNDLNSFYYLIFHLLVIIRKGTLEKMREYKSLLFVDILNGCFLIIFFYIG